MASQDLYNRVTVVQAFGFSPITPVAVSSGADTQGFQSVTTFIVPEFTSSVEFIPAMIIGFQDNDEGTSVNAPWEDVLAPDLIGDPEKELMDELNIPRKLGYIGKKRYVRVIIRKFNPEAIMRVCGVIVLGAPSIASTGPSTE